jgi:hypothetical protein
VSKPLFQTIYVSDFNSIQKHTDWLINNRKNKHNARLYPAKMIKIDFSRCRFLKPYHIAPLACMIHEYQKDGFVIKLGNIPQPIAEYFATFNFNQFCQKEDTNSFPDPKDPKTLPLWRIESSAFNLYPKKAQEYFENNHFDGKSLFALSLSLAELMNNVFDHAESKIPGYTFTQYNTRNNEITTCVCDFGIGIPNKVNNYLKQTDSPVLDQLAALQMAFTHKFSTQSKPHNRGNGWDNIFSNVKGLNSKILIVSNNICYYLLNNGDIRTSFLSSKFPGTLVVIYLNAKNLPVKEEEISDELVIL